MNNGNDSWIVSLIWGRIGAAVLAIAAMVLGYLGFNIDDAAQAQIFDLVSAVLAGVAGILALVSKIREGRKAAK